MQGSLSKISVVVEVVGKGSAEGEVFRHLSPRTLSEVLRRLPLRGRVVRVGDNLVYFPTELQIGLEKPKRSFGEGDIGFMPASGGLCFFLRDAAADRPVNPLGRVTSGLQVLAACGRGDVIAFRVTQS